MTHHSCCAKKAKCSASREVQYEPPPSPPLSSIPTCTTTPTSTNTNSLRDFIRRDVEPGYGYRILLPFLTTKDILTLSECSKHFLRYRTHLSRLRIVEHPNATARLKRALIQLLAEQKGSLSHLFISYSPAISLLDQIGWGPCAKLHTLDLSSARLTNKDAAAVGRGLSSGALRHLVELVLSSDFAHDEITAAGLACLTQALSKGVFPSLRRLVLSFDIGCEGEGAGEGIRAVLESGACRRLQHLDLSRTFLGVQGGVAIAQALEAGACPELMSLELSECQLVPCHGYALGQALRFGACPKLSVLSLGHNPDLWDEGTMPIMEALEAGSCPNLHHLDLSHCHMTSECGAALGRVLSSGVVPQLRSLELFGAVHDSEGSRSILEGIKKGAIPNLRHLNLSASCLDVDHSLLLGEVLSNGTCPQLESLKLSFNPCLGDEGVMHLAKVLERGHGCPPLKLLEMTRTGTGPLGAGAMARAVKSGSMQHIQDFFMFENEAASDEAVIDTMKAIGSGVCPELHWLYAAVASVDDATGKEVVNAFCQGSWPHLQQIVVREKPAEEASVWGIKAGMKVGGKPGLRGLTLCVPDITGGLRWLIQAIRAGGCPALKAVGLSTVPKGEGRVLMKELEDAIHMRLKGRGMAFHSIIEEEEEGNVKEIKGKGRGVVDRKGSHAQQ